MNGRTKIIQTPSIVRSARILRRVREIWGDFLSLSLQWKITSYNWCEKLARDEIIIWQCQKSYMHKPDSVVENEIHKILFVSLRWKPVTKSRPAEQTQWKLVKKNILVILWFCCGPQSENERKLKVNKCPDLDRKQIKLRKMNVTVMTIVAGVIGMVPKGLVKRLGELEIRGRTETIKTTAVLRSVRILRRVLETWRDKGNWRSKEESRPSRPQHCEDKPEYLEESLRPEETPV